MQKSTQQTSKKWQVLERYWTKTIIASILSFWAGNVNGLTTIAILFERSSHVSGRIADIGIDLILMPISAVLVTVIWLSFVMGSYLAGMLLDRIGLTQSLIFQSVCILIGAIAVNVGISASAPGDYGLDRMLMAFILPFSMGFQNSITSQLPLDRTTHWTGASTDLGIALAKGVYLSALFILIKIFAFIVGAAIMAYLIGIIKMPPFYGLLTISAGLVLTAFIGDGVNKKYLRNNVANSI